MRIKRRKRFIEEQSVWFDSHAPRNCHNRAAKSQKKNVATVAAQVVASEIRSGDRSIGSVTMSLL